MSRRTTSRSAPPTFEVRELDASDRPAALALCGTDPVGSILAAVRIAELGPRLHWGPTCYGAYSHARLVALLWAGGNLVPVSPSGAGVADLASTLVRNRRRFSSVVGPAPAVDALWRVLAPVAPVPRQVRRQPSLAISDPPAIAGDARVRLAREEDLPLVLPASVAMFTEEYGYPPTSAGDAYARRVRELVAARRSFVIIEEGPHGPQVLFKADIGAFALGVAQVQGVWVAPTERGAGLGARATAAVVNHAFGMGARTVSLYVNDYNAPARRAYDHVGFTQVGEYATIVL